MPARSATIESGHADWRAGANRHFDKRPKRHHAQTQPKPSDDRTVPTTRPSRLSDRAQTSRGHRRFGKIFLVIDLMQSLVISDLYGSGEAAKFSWGGAMTIDTLILTRAPSRSRLQNAAAPRKQGQKPSPPSENPQFVLALPTLMSMPVRQAEGDLPGSRCEHCHPVCPKVRHPVATRC